MRKFELGSFLLEQRFVIWDENKDKRIDIVFDCDELWIDEGKTVHHLFSLDGLISYVRKEYGRELTGKELAQLKLIWEQWA